MSAYTPPLRDINFVLEHIAGLPELAQLDDFAHADPQMVSGLLDEAGRFCAQAIAPTNQEGDEQGGVLKDDTVVLPDSFKKAYSQYVEAGWGALQFPSEFGGGAFPLAVATAFKEMLTSANMAFSLCPLLTTGAVIDLLEHGDDELQQTFLPKMVSGEWAATMNLSEPQAGSDVGALTTKAEPQDDGTYLINGTKIWITYGEQDMTENIVHLVLARLPDAPPGTKGISLFVVPKYVVNDDGSLGERNDVHVVSIEEKLGIHASPTCVMAYGENSDGAVGYIVGEPNKGMRQMFTMMNDARLGVGLQGLAIAERAYQQAAQYSLERRQGRAPGDENIDAAGQSLIVKHPDVRRMLMTMRAYIEAMRALSYRNAAAIDRSHHADDDEVKERERKMADLLTPLTKAWCTDLGVELTSIAIQIYGGMGYVEETGVAQHYRDARIAPIYEGTNGIQAMDLVGRKLPYDGGEFVKSVVAQMREDAASFDGDLASIGQRLNESLDVLERCIGWLFEHRESFDDAFGAATPFLRMMSTVTGGWLLGKLAAAAKAELDDGGDDDFLRDKIVTARFFAEQLLPQVNGLEATVTAGADDLFAIPDDRLSV